MFFTSVKMKHTINCGFLLLGLFSGPAVMAQALEGFVSGEDGPLPGATVQVSSTTGTVTDTDGYFRFDQLDAGTYELIIRSIGHESMRKTVTVPSENVVRVALQPNSLGLQEVVVTGSMSPVYLKDSPVKTEIITSEHINTFLPSASTGIVETISLINGVQEVVSCGVCFTNAISINGLPGPYTAVLLDGTPMYGNLASVYGLNGIPSSMIERVEVIKGPNSTLYGSEAVAGVINIITKDPSEQPTLNVDFMGTTHKEAFVNISHKLTAGKSTGQLGLNYAYINIFEDENNDGFSDIVNVDRLSLFNKWTLSRPSGRQWTLAGKFYYEDRRNGVEEYMEGRSYRELRGSESVYGESIYTLRGELFGSYEVDFLPDLRVDYSFSIHDQDSYYGADGYQARQKIAFSNLIWSPVFGKHHLVSGLTFRYQYYDDNTIATPQADGQFIPGIFVQDEWKMRENITLLAGSRIDHYERHGWILSPRLNLRIKAGELSTFRANFGTGFRLVNLFTEDHAFVTGQREVVIAGELDPERSVNGSFNFNQILLLGNSQGSLDIDLFYTRFTNKILPDYSVPGEIIYANSPGYATTRGVGLNWSHEFTFPLSFTAGMTFMRATETEETSSGDQKERSIEFAPDYTGTFTLNYHVRRLGMQLAYSSQLTGPMALPEVYDLDPQGNPLPAPRPTESGAFFIHSFQLSKEVKGGLSLYGGVQNLFDYRQDYSPLTGYNDPNTAPGFSNNFDTAYSFSPIHGREFYLGITWSLNK